MNVKPLGNKIVIKREEQKIQGNILLPDSAKEKLNRGIVLAIGPGALNDEGQREALSVKVGDNVLFSSYSGVEFQLNEEEVLVLSENDVLAIVK